MKAEHAVQGHTRRQDKEIKGLLGGREWLAIVQRLQNGQLVGVLFHQVSKLVQNGASFTPSHAGPGTVVKCLYHTFHSIHAKKTPKDQSSTFCSYVLRFLLLQTQRLSWSYTVRSLNFYSLCGVEPDTQTPLSLTQTWSSSCVAA